MTEEALMVVIFDFIPYFIAGTVAGIFLGLVTINVAISVAYAINNKRAAHFLQGILDRFAWPLRLGGGI
jgi:Na+-translocating ferredoxin:NAD+ oxidoreductase RnfA subunit